MLLLKLPTRSYALLFPEILEKLSMHKQCIPGSLSQSMHESLGMRPVTQLTYSLSQHHTSSGQ